jgi:hypothetical protein
VNEAERRVAEAMNRFADAVGVWSQRRAFHQARVIDAQEVTDARSEVIVSVIQGMAQAEDATFLEGILDEADLQVLRGLLTGCLPHQMHP